MYQSEMFVGSSCCVIDLVNFPLIYLLFAIVSPSTLSLSEQLLTAGSWIDDILVQEQ